MKKKDRLQNGNNKDMFSPVESYFDNIGKPFKGNKIYEKGEESGGLISNLINMLVDSIFGKK